MLERGDGLVAAWIWIGTILWPRSGVSLMWAQLTRLLVERVIGQPPLM